MQRLLLSGILTAQKQQELIKVAHALDSMRLFQQVRQLHQAVFRYAVNVPPLSSITPSAPVRVFSVGYCMMGSVQVSRSAPDPTAGLHTLYHEMDPKNLKIEAAVGLPSETGWTGTAREIGTYCAITAFHKMMHFCSNSHYFNTEFMTKNPWIRKEWLIAMKGVVVSSAHAYLSNAN